MDKRVIIATMMCILCTVVGCGLECGGLGMPEFSSAALPNFQSGFPSTRNGTRVSSLKVNEGLEFLKLTRN